MLKGRAKRKISPAPRGLIELENMNLSGERASRKRSKGKETGIQNKSKRSRADHFVIQMGENVTERDPDANHDQDAENSHDTNLPEENSNLIFSFSFSYMSTHFDIMQLMQLLYVGKKDRILSWKSAFHVAAFGLSYLLAIMWEVGRGKHYMITHLKKTTVFYIISTWFYFHTAFVTIIFLRLVFQNAVGKFSDNVETTKAEGTKKGKKEPTNKISKVSVGLAILNIMISLYISSGSNLIFFKDFDHVDVLLVRAFQFKGRFFYWDKTDYNYRLNQLDNITTLETEDVIYGCTEVGIRLVGWLHYTAMKETVLVSALTLHSFTNEFKDFMYDTRNEPMSISLLGKLEDNWDVLHLVSNDIESQFGSLFNMIAIDNWLNGAYCILRFMQDDFQFDGEFVVNVIMFSKSLLAYILAAIARKTGPMLKRRLNTKSPRAGSTKDMVLKANIVYFEQKIDNTPVGMGAGNFLMDETFVYKYIGSVMTTSVAFMDHQKKDKEA